MRYNPPHGPAQKCTPLQSSRPPTNRPPTPSPTFLFPRRHNVLPTTAALRYPSQSSHSSPKVSPRRDEPSSTMAASDSLGNFFFVPEPDYSCPGSPFKCPPPSACSRDPTTGRTFCCDPESVCYSGSTTCASDGSTFECGTEGSWCCTSETCVLLASSRRDSLLTRT